MNVMPPAAAAPGTEQEQAIAIDAVIEQTSEEQAAAAQQKKEKRQQTLDALGASLETLKNAAIEGRRETEKRWLEDLRQYHSVPEIMPGTKDSVDAAEYRKTNDNITRSKVLLVAARLGDMLFPTNDANWDLQASPSPQLPPNAVSNVDAQGAPLTPDALKAARNDYARKAAQAMKIEVADNLAESDYAAHGRNAIFQAAQLGTGVIKGPFTKTRKQTTWSNDGSQKRTFVDMATPGVCQVDIWSFYPQPSRSMDECEHVFELHMMPPSKVRRLARQPGFDPSQINRLLEIVPTLGALVTGAEADRRGMLNRANMSSLTDGRYPVWEYTGPIPKDALVAFITNLALDGGIPDEAVGEIADILQQDNLTQIDAEIWMSQGIVLKAMLRPVRECETLGYYVFNYETDPDDIFGFGVPYLCRDDAIAANMVWHSIMLNTMMSSGPQIGVRKGAMEPSQGKSYDFSCTKPRVWVMSEEADDIEKAISVFNVPNVVGRMMPVYERIKLNADEHTMMPMIAQGEPSSAVPTTGGMAMIMNAANVVMRRLAKRWDDSVTNKLLPEMVAWNEQNNPKEEIRGDCCVIPKGASHLLIKDIQAQHIQFATQLFTSNPLLQPYMKAGHWARANLDILELPTGDMLKTDDDVAAEQAKQGEQANPEVLKAQALQAQAEAAQKRADAEARSKDADIAFKERDRDLDHQERMRELDIRESTMAMQLQAARFNYMHKLASLDSSERIAMAQIAKDLNIDEADKQLRKYGIDFQGSLDAQRMADNKEKVATEIAVESPNPRIQ